MHPAAPPILSLWSAQAGFDPGQLPEDLDRLEGIASSPADALARAAQRHPGRDVLLSTPDALWPVDGWQRLWSAWQAAPDCPVLSALDASLLPAIAGASATAMDEACWAWGEHHSFDSDRISLRASLWRGSSLTLPLRGEPGLEFVAGARFLPCLWIGGGTTAPNTDPPDVPSWNAALLELRDRLAGCASSTLPQLRRDLPVVLHVLHGWGGGVERFARDLAAADRERQHLLLVARGDDHFAPLGRYLDLHADLDQPPLRRWALANPVPDTVEHSPEIAGVLAAIIGEWGVGAVLVSSVIGHSLDVLRTGLPTVWCAHDAYPFWPLLHELPDHELDPVEDSDLAARLAQAGDGMLFANRDAGHWRRLRAATMAALTAARLPIVYPSRSAQRGLLMRMPALAELSSEVIELGTPAIAPLSSDQADAGRPLRVLLPGHLAGGKGEVMLKALLPLLPEGIELIALGCGDAAAQRLSGKPQLEVHAHYRHDELPGWIARLQPDMAMLPSTIPETWSYSYSEMTAFGIPTLCPDLGALADRVRAGGYGWLEAPEAPAFAKKLVALAKDRSAIQAMRERPRPTLPTLAAMTAAWQQVLPARKQVPLLVPASDAVLARLAQWHVLARLKSTAQARAQQVQTEATAHARLLSDAAQARERQLSSEAAAREQHLSAQAAAREQQLIAEARLAEDRLAAELHEVNERLSRAYALYERDTREIARQRDAVLHLRDVGDAEIAHMLASNSWQLTRPLRFINRVARRLRADISYRARRFRTRVTRGLASLRSRGLLATIRHWRMLRAMSATMPESSQVAETLAAVDVSNLRLPESKAPQASIVIPVYNQLEFTLRCLQSLAFSGDATPFEVIVVDDGSSDDSAKRLPKIAGLRYHRNAHNLGFIGACNAGADLARGEFVVFLNNDTEVGQGWLDALLSTFIDHPDTGLAGSKLVYPDGRLQEAGGIIFSDGSAWNYGRNENPEDPRFNFVREVDYCSGAAIAMRRALFAELSGFDALYSPAYYEDADLAMRVRKQGLKVRYQPASVVVHFEGVTSGTDLSQGTKAYQVTNQKKFLARWRETLAAAHPSPRASGDIARAADHGKALRVLVIDACTPMPDRDAGSVRMLELMRVLLDQGCAVSFFADNHAYDGHYTTDLQRFGVEAWWGTWLGDTPSWLGKNGSRFDLVIVSRHYILSPLLPLLREYAPKAQVVFDTVDLHFLREEREAEQSDDRLRRLSARRTRDSELRLIKQADATWVVSGFEQSLLQELVPEATIAVVSTIHTAITDTAGVLGRQDLIFVGGYRHPPNVDAALWLAKDILPRVRARYPHLRLHLVGSEAPPEISALGEIDGVVFHGHVRDLDALLDTALIGLAPLRFGAGVKGKINQYLSRGLPVVATACATEGMHLVNEQDVLVADDAGSFADAIARLIDDAALWQQLREAGWANTRRFFSRDTAKAALAPLLESLQSH